MRDKRPDQDHLDRSDAGDMSDTQPSDGRSREKKLKSKGGKQERSGGMSDDARIDEQSDESFPASDPPQQP